MQERDDQIRKLREEAVHAQKSRQQQVEEEAARQTELREQLEHLSLRKEELKQQLEDKDAELEEVRRVHRQVSPQNKKIQTCKDMLKKNSLHHNHCIIRNNLCFHTCFSTPTLSVHVYKTAPYNIYLI